MAKQGGLGGRFFVGANNLSGDVTAINAANGGPALLDTTSLDKSGMERIGGVRTGHVGVTSWFNPDAGEHAAWSGLPTTDVQVMYCVGSAIGASAVACIGKQVNYDGSRAEDGGFTFVTDVESNGFGIEWGTLLSAGPQVSSSAGNFSSLDENPDGTTNFGLQLYVHLLAFTGTSVTVNIQSSTDDGGGDAFATVTGATSGALTTPGTVRVATGPTAAVERYLRANMTGTYTNAELVIMVVRNQTTPS